MDLKISPFIYPGLTDEGRRIALKKSPEEIMNRVCDHFHIKPGDVVNKGRRRELVEIRMIIMVLLRKYSQLTYWRIGVIFQRDHSTVIYSMDTVKGLVKTSSEFKDKFEGAEQALFL